MQIISSLGNEWKATRMSFLWAKFLRRGGQQVTPERRKRIQSGIYDILVKEGEYE